MNLDLKDRKILYQLDLDARQSYTEIAKKVRLSKEVVQYRVKKLEERGIIQYFMTVIDSNRLGYLLFRCFIKCQNLDANKEREIVEWLTPRVGWVVNIRGRWDFNVAIWTRDIHEFMAFWNAFYTKFSNTILEYTCNPIPKMWLYRRGWLLHNDKDTNGYDIWGGRAESVNIDEIDRKILASIVTAARKPSLEIAHELSISEGTVRNRLRRLEKEKIILRYAAFLNTAALGMRYIKLHFSVKEINAKTVSQIREYAHLNPFILYANEAIGGHFLEFDLNVESYEQLYRIIEEFREQFPNIITTYEYCEYVKEHKFEYLPRTYQR